MSQDIRTGRPGAGGAGLDIYANEAPGGTPPPVHGDAILMEDGVFYVLMEDGSRILME